MGKQPGADASGDRRQAWSSPDAGRDGQEDGDRRRVGDLREQERCDRKEERSRTGSLHAKLGQSIMERVIIVENLRLTSVARRRELVASRNLSPSVARLFEFREISRSGIYYEPAGDSEADMTLMRVDGPGNSQQGADTFGATVCDRDISATDDVYAGVATR